MEYTHLIPKAKLPDISKIRPFRAVLVLDEAVDPEWQQTVSEWLVDSGCLYMMAWGANCSTWDDSVDLANVESFKGTEIPESSFVMTTWHEQEPLSEVFWYCKNNAHHPIIDIKNTLVLHIAKDEQEERIRLAYESA